MKTKEQLRFDLDTLRSLAGDKVFARGQEYHRSGQVLILAIEPRLVLAQVAGTDEYRTRLTVRGREIGGECSCRAFTEWGFCKHMVATALTANEAGNDPQAEGAGVLARIRDHLGKKEIGALVAIIMEVAEQDPAWLRRLNLASASAGADDKTVEARLRKTLDQATRTGGFVEYGAAAGWAGQVDTVLDAIGDLVSSDRPAIALRLCERAIDRIEEAIETIDDSDGECGGLLERARDIHVAAAVAARPEPVRFARDLFTREMEGSYGTFEGAVALYADALGDRGLAEYRRLATEAWEKLPSRVPSRQPREVSGNYRELANILDFFAERDSDVEARIALRCKDLSSPWSYLALAEFCLSHGRTEEALRRAEDGLWLFEDHRQDERLAFFAVDLLVQAGRSDDAEAHLWRLFEKQPNLNVYTRLRELGGEPARDRAVKFLSADPGAQKPPRWHYSAELLIGILLQETMFDAAWTAARRHGASMNLKHALARASESTHPRDALQVYEERVETLANTGGEPAYAEAAELVGRMAALRSAAEHRVYVEALKARFGRRRNFMKRLA